VSEEQSLALAKRLKAAREQAGLSQEAVAQKLGLKRPAVSEFEAGRRKVSARELVILAGIYHVSMEWLTSEGTGQPEKFELAARGLLALKSDDLDRILDLIRSLRDPDKK